MCQASYHALHPQKRPVSMNVPNLGFLIHTLPCIGWTKLEAAFLRLKGALISC